MAYHHVTPLYNGNTNNMVGGYSATGPARQVTARPAPAPGIPTSTTTGAPAAAPPPPAAPDPNLDVYHPGIAETTAPGLIDKLGQQGQAGQFWDSQKGINHNENFNQYYDQAEKDQGNAIDRAFSSRGNYKGSAATDTLAHASMQLRAEQANRRDASQQAWTGINSGMANSAANEDLGRINSSFNIAQGGQQAKRARVQDYFNNIYGPTSGLMNMAFNAGTGAVEGDQGLMGDAWNARLGGTRTAAGNAQQGNNNLMQGAGIFMQGMGGRGPSNGSVPSGVGQVQPPQGPDDIYRPQG
jgi:hypothetical protein